MLNINQFAQSAKQNNAINYTYGSLMANSTNPIAQTSKVLRAPVDLSAVKDEFVVIKKKRTLIEKTADLFKNMTGLGFGSKKVEKTIKDVEIGNKDKEEVDKVLKQYKASQENTIQAVGDTLSAVTGLFVFYGGQKLAKYTQAWQELDAAPSFIKNAKGVMKLVPGMDAEKSIAISNKKAALLALPFMILAGGLVKNISLKLDRIGSKKYKLTKQEAQNLNDEEKRDKKKILKSTKRGQNFRNFFTGGLNAVMAPFASLLGIAGVPLYGAGSFLTRHLTAHDKGGKVADDFKNNAVVNLLGTAAVGVSMVKSHNYHKLLSKNMDSVIKDLKDAKFMSPDIPSSKTAYQELEEILFADSNINELLEKAKYSSDKEGIGAIIQDLTDENIFAVKFKQIMNSGDELTSALRENCPATRSLDEAQGAINSLLGNEEYTVSKLLGVGTVAETYLAKDKSGKEVCIKILKEGISVDKIKADKEKFAQMITQGLSKEALSENQKYLLRNLDDLSDGILKEVDFKNEMEAAKQLAKHTKRANVVVPIEAKDGIYIMERAKGISLDSLQKYYSLQSSKNWMSKILQSEDNSWCKNRIKEIDAELDALKARCPDFEDFDLTTNEVRELLQEYINVQAEQFHKVENGGKVLHADIHPGNIFIDIDAVKSRRNGNLGKLNNKKMFTLIDTGNTITMSTEQSRRALRFTNWVKNGNAKDIAKYALDGATIPEGIKYEEALKLLEDELSTAFFSPKVRFLQDVRGGELASSFDNDSVLALASNIMRKHGIIPSDTQLNLNKAKTSAANSFGAIAEAFFENKENELLNGAESLKDMNRMDALSAGASMVKEIGRIMAKYKAAPVVEETKGLLRMSPKDILANLRNKNMNKTNSKNYLIYKLKQTMSISDEEKLARKLAEMQGISVNEAMQAIIDNPELLDSFKRQAGLLDGLFGGII